MSGIRASGTFLKDPNDDYSHYLLVTDVERIKLELLSVENEIAALEAGAFTQADASALYLTKANNLSDLVSASTARTNLGLGSIAVYNTNNISVDVYLTRLAGTGTGLSNHLYFYNAESTDPTPGFGRIHAAFNSVLTLTATNVAGTTASVTLTPSGVFTVPSLTSPSATISGTITAASGVLTSATISGGTATLSSLAVTSSLSMTTYAGTAHFEISAFDHTVAIGSPASHTLNVKTIAIGSDWTGASESGSTTALYGRTITLGHSAAADQIKIGGGNTCLLGFLGATPIAQITQAAPSAIVTTGSAGGTYTSTEQGMINHLKTDVTNLQATLNTLITNLKSGAGAYGLFA